MSRACRPTSASPTKRWPSWADRDAFRSTRVARRAARGCQCPVAGRSRRASCPTLTACPLRFAILAALAPIARLPGHCQPLATFQPDPAILRSRRLATCGVVEQVSNLFLNRPPVRHRLKTCATRERADTSRSAPAGPTAPPRPRRASARPQTPPARSARPAASIRRSRTAGCCRGRGTPGSY